MENVKVIKTVSIFADESAKVKEANINFSKFISWCINEKLDEYKND